MNLFSTNSTLVQVRLNSSKTTKYLQLLNVYLIQQNKILADKITDGLHVLGRGQRNLRNRLLILDKH